MYPGEGNVLGSFLLLNRLLQQTQPREKGLVLAWGLRAWEFLWGNGDSRRLQQLVTSRPQWGHSHGSSSAVLSTYSPGSEAGNGATHREQIFPTSVNVIEMIPKGISRVLFPRWLQSLSSWQLAPTITGRFQRSNFDMIHFINMYIRYLKRTSFTPLNAARMILYFFSLSYL